MKAQLIKAFVLGSLFYSINIFAAQSNDCNRNCLSNALDQYMNAVVANDSSLAPLMIGFRQTDNAVVVQPGSGVWKSVTSMGEVQREFFDPVTGQAAFFGIVNEGNKPIVVTVRVKVIDREIAEAEWYIGRDGDTGAQGPEDNNLYDSDNLIANPPPAQRSVPRRQRLSRASLLGITNSYFDGITTHDGSIIHAKPGCLRVENGLQTTGRPQDENGTGGLNGLSDCTSGMERVGTLGISLVAGRRYPLIDEEQQVVLGTVVFLRNPNSHLRRNGLSEFFYIENNLITDIYAAMFYPNPDQPVPNWPPYVGNFPLPADFGAAK